MTANKILYEIQQKRLKEAEAERKRVRELLEQFKKETSFRKDQNRKTDGSAVRL